MSLRRQKFVFDVHIPDYVQSGKIDQAQWRSVLRFLSSRARYAVSSISLYELIAGIEGGDDAHFLKNRDRLKILCEPAGREFLPLAADFVRRVVFKRPIRAQAFESGKLKRWVKVILNARSKGDLRAGNVLVDGQSYGSDIAPLVAHIREGKRRDVERFEKLQRGQLKASTPESWARQVLLRMDIPASVENLAALQSTIDAAWHYELFRYGMAKDPRCNFAKKASDWLDSQLLYYLADPQLHLVTFDARLRSRVRDSQQSNRVVLFEDLMATAKGSTS